MIGGAIARVAGGARRRRARRCTGTAPPTVRAAREGSERTACSWVWPCRIASAPRSRTIRSNAGRVRKTAQRRRDAGDRRVMDEHDPRQPLAPVSPSRSGERLELPLAELPGRHQRAGRHGRGEADDRDLAANAKIGIGRLASRRVARRPGRERRLEQRHDRAHIGVMIAGNEADVAPDRRASSSIARRGGTRPACRY